MKKRKLKKWVLILIVIIIILLILGGCWWLFFRDTDEEPPKITLTKESVSLYVGDEWKPDTYIQSITDDQDGDLRASESEAEGCYWLIGKVDTSKEGEYTVTIHASDQSGNKTEKAMKITVKKRVERSEAKVEEKPQVVEEPQEPAVNSAQTIDSGGYPVSADPYQAEPYYVNGVLLVNKKHPLPVNYGGLDSTAAAALAQLQSAAQSAGYSIPTISGYRSYDYQATLYNNYVQRDGQAAADTYSARPGFSEHQSGLAFDVGAIDNNYGETAAGTWLREHCHEFGFIIRYQQGKESITGFMYEPWHIRYVGVNIATDIMQRGITLEEYLGDY